MSNSTKISCIGAMVVQLGLVDELEHSCHDIIEAWNECKYDYQIDDLHV